MDSKDQLLVKSSYEVLHGTRTMLEGWKRFWNKLVPARVLVFRGLGRLQKMLTMDKLRRRRHSCE